MNSIFGLLCRLSVTLDVDYALLFTPEDRYAYPEGRPFAEAIEELPRMGVYSLMKTSTKLRKTHDLISQVPRQLCTTRPLYCTVGQNGSYIDRTRDAVTDGDSRRDAIEHSLTVVR